MSVLYDKLKAIEEEVDELCLKKKLGIEAEYLKRIKCKKAVRCYVSVFLANGVFLRLDSRVINDYRSGAEMKFSDVVKRFCVVFDSDLVSTSDAYCSPPKTQGDSVSSEAELQSNAGVDPVDFFEWTKSDGGTEAFEVRSEKKPKNIKLVFDLENPREIFRLSPALRDLFMKCTDTKPGVLTCLWRYVNRNGLASTDSDVVVCDSTLREIFGVDSFTFAELPDIVVPHLCPLEYLVVDIPSIDGYTEIFDIPFEWDDLYQHPSIYSPKIYGLERKIESLEHLLLRCKEREGTLRGFHEDPQGFINRWLCIDSGEPCHRTPFFCDVNVQKNVFELLRRLE